MDIDFNAVFSLQFFKCHIDMELAHAAENHFMRLIVPREFQGGILFDKFVKTQAHLFDIGLRFRLERERHKRSHQRGLGNDQRGGVGGQRITGLCILELRNGDNVASHGRFNLHIFLADCVKQFAALFFDASRSIKKSRVGMERA